jgi:hypothetical protein
LLSFTAASDPRKKSACCDGATGSHEVYCLGTSSSPSPLADLAPNQAVVAPREARDLGRGRRPMKWVVVPQWVRTGDGASPPGSKPRQQGRSALHVHPPAMGVRHWMARGGRARHGAPKWVTLWTAGYLSRQYGGDSRRFPVAGRPPAWGRKGEHAGPHRGLRAGHAGPGGARARGRATGLLVTLPEWGPG